MAYKAVFNGDSLYHFNPNHDPKTGRFTFSKGDLIDKNGRLTNTGKELYGLDKFDRNPVYNISPKAASKQFYKDINKIGLNNNNYTNLLTKRVVETQEMASRRFWNDVKKANENQEFVNDFKNEVKKFYDLVRSGKGDNRSFDQVDSSISFLSKKYPQFKELMEGYSPYQYFNHYDEDEWNKYKKSKYREEKGTYKIAKGLGKYETKSYTDVIDPITEMMNYDFYYEPREYTVSKELAMDIIDSVNKEYTNIFIDKYGKNKLPKDLYKYL